MSNLAPLTPMSDYEALIIRAAISCAAAGQELTAVALSARTGLPLWVVESCWRIHTLDGLPEPGVHHDA